MNDIDVKGGCTRITTRYHVNIDAIGMSICLCEEDAYPVDSSITRWPNCLLKHSWFMTVEPMLFGPSPSVTQNFCDKCVGPSGLQSESRPEGCESMAGCQHDRIVENTPLEQPVSPGALRRWLSRWLISVPVLVIRHKGDIAAGAAILVLLWIILADCCLAAQTQTHTEDNLARIYQSMLDHLAAREFENALRLAEQVVDLLPSVRPASESEHAASLCNLALLQRRLGYLRKSKRNFKSCVSTFEEVNGHHSRSLVEPLQHLSELYFHEQDYTSSVDTLRRVQHIMHRTDGVYTLDQLAVVEDISRSYIRAGRIKEADQQQRFYNSINEANYDANNPRMMPVRSKFGYWLKKSGQFDEALGVFQENLNMISNIWKGPDLEVAATLREIAVTSYLAGGCCPLESMQRATNIVIDDPATDSEDRIGALLELADMSLLNSQVEEAQLLYQQAWDLMDKGTQGEAKAEEFFSAPVMLGVSKRHDVNDAYYRILLGPDSALSARSNMSTTKVIIPQSSPPLAEELVADLSLIGAPLPLCANHILGLEPGMRSADLAEYHLSLEFSVNGSGQVFGIVAGDQNVSSRLRRYVRKMLYMTRFRPRLVAGETVTAEHIDLHQSFGASPQSEWFADSTFDLGALTVYRSCQETAAIQI